MNPETEQQTDERIEAVLAALREAQPRAGLEQRIHAAVLRAADAAGPAKPRMASLHWPQLAGVTAAVASLVLLSVHLHLQQANQPLHNRARARIPGTAAAAHRAGTSADSAGASRRLCPTGATDTRRPRSGTAARSGTDARVLQTCTHACS